MAENPLTSRTPGGTPNLKTASSSDFHPIGQSNDISKIILPQSGAPSVLSASRGPAGDALRAANYVDPQAPAPHTLERLTNSKAAAANALPDVPALHTYKGDIASSIQQHNISLADMAQAQSNRAHELNKPTKSENSWQWRHVLRISEIVLGCMLFVAATGMLAWAYLRVAPVPGTAAVTAPYLFVDQKKNVTLKPTSTRETFLSAIDDTLKSSGLAAGLVGQLAISYASSTAPEGVLPMSTQQFFALMAPKAPDSLARSLDAQFLLGIHSLSSTEPFLLFKTDEYEQAFAGMLVWEYTMQAELSPLFPKPLENAPLGTTTQATSTPATRTSSIPRVLDTPFVDRILNNHDVRLIRDREGTTVLLWAFVNRTTLVITTNADTLQEIILRLQKAATITVPSI